MAIRVTRQNVARGLRGSFCAVALCLCAASSGAGQSDPLSPAAASGVPLRYDRVPLSVAVDAVLRASTTAGYVLCDKVLNDKRLVSLRFQPYQLTMSNVTLWLAAQGYALRPRGGVLYVCTSDDRKGVDQGSGAAGSEGRVQSEGGSNVPARYSDGVGGGPPVRSGGPVDPRVDQQLGVPVGSPLQAGPVASYSAGGPAAPLGVYEVAAYRPDYVDPTTIADVARSMLPELSVAVSTAKLDARPAVFVRGAPELVQRFQVLAHYVDTPADLIEVRAIIAEVGQSGRSGWSIRGVVSALSSKLGVTIGGAGSGLANGGDSLSFSSASFDGVLSAISTQADTRVLDTPRVTGRSGEALRLQVGDDVPILGAVFSPGVGSTTAQEVTYRSSGVIFEVTPVVHGKTVTLALAQEVSAFSETQTGVRGSPTLSKRSLNSSLDVSDGEWIIMGGLTSSRNVSARNSLFGVIPTGRGRDTRQTEMVLLLNVRVIRREAARSGVVSALPASLGDAPRSSRPRQK